ncbi:uncharacterized protein [Musca autumnalis]|uniref:uncharacterized protein n=1 Tax=Musca autumnalis TaxID=221902 RepID=UPI003CF9F0AF
MTATFRTRVRNATIIQCYAPTETSPFCEKDRFYSKLNGTLNNIPPGNIKILLGDFNAKVGANNDNLTNIMDTRNKRSADIGSDHHLLIGEFRLKIVRTDTRNIHTSTRLDIQKLKNPNIRQQYRQQLQLNITNIAPHGNVDSKWNAIKDAFIDAGSKVLGHQRKTKKDWICTTTWEVIDERRRKKAAVNSARTRASKEAAYRQYETLNKSVKRRISGRQKRFQTIGYKG